MRHETMALLAGNNGNTSTISMALLVLGISNLFLLLSKIEASPGKVKQFEPLSFVGSRLSAMAMAYLSTATYAGKHHHTPGELLSRMLSTWRRPAITLAYVELFATASASLLMALRAFAGAAGDAAPEALVISGSLALLSCLGPVVFAHSEIACRLSLVVAVAEEDFQGMSALARAEELVREKKLQGFVLTAALGVAEQAVLAMFGCNNDGGVWGIGTLLFAAPVLLVLKFVTYFVYTMFYFECKKGDAKEKRLILEA
ncbi:hypothetical protein OPV22_007848 [Ensete ventricosum]|uniref:Solute carrier family 40 protein n=1 Tax=Ensete ventricosum TaxID=4639 RepID=A0AAV8R5A9_ENSVE|nr:hypothetical protein OPV22_007848 [Ensete ventricosum]